MREPDASAMPNASAMLSAIAQKRAQESKHSSTANNEIVLPADHTANPSGTPNQRKSRRKGKRSDPNYKQTGVYLPTDLTSRVKKRLYDYDIDFSDLIAELLAQWETQEAAKEN